VGLKVKGLGSIGYQLENMAKRASEGARFAMKEGAEDIRDLARLHAPVDEGNLEDAIKMEVVSGARGRHSFKVHVDESHPAVITNEDGSQTSGNRTVGDYAFDMHEGNYLLGPGSQHKQSQVGVKVGPKYLQRAYKKMSKQIHANVRQNVNNRIGK